MSYNITSSKILKMEGFSIPIDIVQKGISDRHLGHITLLDPIQGKVRVGMAEGHLEGIMATGSTTFLATDLKIYGEGSGYIMHTFLLPTLERSSGNLELRLVWEGGDTVEYVTVKDGHLERQDI